MRKTILAAGIAMTLAVPALGVEFLGVELCGDPVSTAIRLPEGSPLEIKSLEVGKQGGLVILFSAQTGEPLQLVDDLMEVEIGRRGSGSEKELTWTGADVVAYAQPISISYAALAIRGGSACASAAETESTAPAATSAVPVASATDSTAVGPPPATSTAADPPAPPAVNLLPATSAVAPAPQPKAVPDFELLGVLQHQPAADDWVDVMGVVANHTGDGYKLATFDLSLYDDAGRLICVDTISVSVLKSGQERAFRDSIQCPEYGRDKVERYELQFAGGY